MFLFVTTKPLLNLLPFSSKFWSKNTLMGAFWKKQEFIQKKQQFRFDCYAIQVSCKVKVVMKETVWCSIIGTKTSLRMSTPAVLVMVNSKRSIKIRLMFTLCKGAIFSPAGGWVKRKSAALRWVLFRSKQVLNQQLYTPHTRLLSHSWISGLSF